ncbi:hypothetical protein PAF17_15985 [Paracoccus sp. Z330]|uniref:Uncharacterized protein n=1 Tax=Paracoccus onchidii TaxID=3017813 RepID=A0ABT4ZI54_9RHOB|nr:hypothetical protein [Paracoccus onchidii]MDB6178992.1 hypothetical protein [Paracoccus onchidii]
MPRKNARPQAKKAQKQKLARIEAKKVPVHDRHPKKVIALAHGNSRAGLIARLMGHLLGAR